MSKKTKPAAARMTDGQKAEHIRKVVLDAGVALRQRHPWLRHQNTIGASIMVVSLLGMIASGWLYVEGVIPWWVCVPVTAIFASFIHELEHDLIHHMYFRDRPWANNLMMLLGWGTLAVPTGIVTAEMTSHRLGQKGQPTTRTCHQCLSEGHLPEAIYCLKCGAKLPNYLHD